MEKAKSGVRFSKIIVSVLVADMILYAWVWNIVYAITGIAPLEDLTRNLYLHTGGELALVFAASSVGNGLDLLKAKGATTKKTDAVANSG